MIGLVRGGATLMLLLVFLGIVAWAFSNRRKEEFEALARLALDPDPGEVSKSTPPHSEESGRE
jgi:cbb3-type cytochrome oxidase subunit 3